MSAFGKLDVIIMNLLKAFDSQITNLCDIETIDGHFSAPEKSVMVYKDGSCASIFRFNGIANVIGSTDYEDIIEQLTRTLEPFFKNRGHQLQVVFRKDLDASDSLDLVSAIQKHTAKTLQLDIEDLIEESRDKYKAFVYEEDCYFVLISRTALLDRTEVRMDNELKNKIRKEIQLPSMKKAQNILRPVSYLYDRHLSFVEKVFDDLKTSSIACFVEKLDIESALREIKRNANRSATSPNWKPVIPGQAARARMNGEPDINVPHRWKTDDDYNDGSEFLYPSIPDQILNTTGKVGAKNDKNIPDDEFFRVGSRVFAPVLFSVPPRMDNEHFNNLFSALNRAETHEDGIRRAIPYAISFMIGGDGMGPLMMKSLFSSILSFSSEQNRNINLAIAELRERKRDYEVIVKFKISAMTWGKTDPDSLQSLVLRKTHLIKAIEGWGGAQVKEYSGDASLAWQATIPGLSTKSIAPPAAAPLEGALKLFPVLRPTSPFPGGTIINRSLDGAILPYARFSDEQTTWITLVSGKPGSGKSVLMNHLNLESILSPGISRLPYIMIIDIGISSRGLIDTVRDALPHNLKHLAVYERLQNTKQYAINVFDTPLGQRMPLERDLAFKRSFITALITPSERDDPEEGMSSFVGRVIKESYRFFQTGLEKSRPKSYIPHDNEIVDKAMEELGIEFSGNQTIYYWDLVDTFFDNNMIYAAEVAQRYAVPCLGDLALVANGEIIKEEYKSKPELIDKFLTGLKEAQEEYEMFREPTKFELGSARVVSLDLQDLAGKDTSRAGVKKTNLLYMVSRQSFIQKIGYSLEDLPSIEPKYRSYFERIISQLIDEEKILMMDEYHKTKMASNSKASSPLQDQIMTDAREARKWKMDITLGSQKISDFGNILSIATTVFILDAGSPEERRDYTNLVGLNDTALEALNRFVHGPSAIGTTYIGMTETKRGRFVQLYTSTLGPMRLWALSTTSEDRKMRNLFYARINDQREARKALAYYFPKGGCKDVIEREKRLVFTDGTFVDEKAEEGIIETIADRLISDWNARKDRAEV